MGRTRRASRSRFALVVRLFPSLGGTRSVVDQIGFLFGAALGHDEADALDGFELGRRQRRCVLTLVLRSETALALLTLGLLRRCYHHNPPFGVVIGDELLLLLRSCDDGSGFDSGFQTGLRRRGFESMLDGLLGWTWPRNVPFGLAGGVRLGENALFDFLRIRARPRVVAVLLGSALPRRLGGVQLLLLVFRIQFLGVLVGDLPRSILGVVVVADVVLSKPLFGVEGRRVVDVREAPQSLYGRRGAPLTLLTTRSPFEIIKALLKKQFTSTRVFILTRIFGLFHSYKYWINIYKNIFKINLQILKV